LLGAAELVCHLDHPVELDATVAADVIEEAFEHE
jgi:hypothetical protein